MKDTITTTHEWQQGNSITKNITEVFRAFQVLNNLNLGDMRN